MLDINYIRQNPDKVKQNNKIRQADINIDDILNLDKKRKKLVSEADEKKSILNKSSKTKPSPEQIKELRRLSEDIKQIQEKIKPVEKKLNDFLSQLPNMTHKSVPIGKDENDNKEIKIWGDKPQFDFDIKEHWQLGEELDLIDTERGAKVSGSRFWYLKRDLVMLEFALIQYAANFMRKQSFIPMLVPMLVREQAMYGTGFFPADKNEIYKVNQEEDDMYLIGTAEVPLASYHCDEVIDIEKKPLKYFGFSSCFRREAGTYGKDTKGILRGHQFNKIEMFVFCDEDSSWKIHEEMLKISEEFWQSLKIPYRILNMCSADIGAPNAKKYDIEAWLPSQNNYREVASCSNDTDFQSRRLKIKYKDSENKLKYAHTLNNTVTAIGRTIIAIMENYQQKDGSIKIPEVLVSLMNGQEEIKKES